MLENIIQLGIKSLTGTYQEFLLNLHLTHSENFYSVTKRYVGI